MEVNWQKNLPANGGDLPMRTFAFYQNLGFFPGGPEGQSQRAGSRKKFFYSNDNRRRARANAG
jgi:hypothetical protein